MSGKYDPPNKEQLVADNPRISSTVKLMVAAAGARFPPKVKTEDKALCAGAAGDSKVLPHTQARAMDHPNLKRGRKRVVTLEKIHMICGRITNGETEQSACIRAGISSTAWNAAKRSDANLRERIAGARDDWALSGTCNTRLRFTKANRHEQPGGRRLNLNRSDKRNGWCATSQHGCLFTLQPSPRTKSRRPANDDGHSA